jgi:hypothetical protein
MRKIDKKLNLQKVNILTEQRYLQSKSLLKESFHMPDGTPIGVDHMHRPISKINGVQKTDSDIDELANEIIRNSNGDETKENELIVKTAAGDEDIQRRLTNRISRIKNA